LIKTHSGCGGGIEMVETSSPESSSGRNVDCFSPEGMLHAAEIRLK
jgi:hypothetical protein